MKGSRESFGEWPTVVAIASCYAFWIAVTLWSDALGLLWIPAAAVAAAFHSSLQHEALHGHPTRDRRVNEALVFWPLAMTYPYRRFRAQHLRHHDDTSLTDPYDDPESWYLAERDYADSPLPVRLLLAFNATLLGRLIVGPLLGVYGFWRADVRAWRTAPGGLRDQISRAWALHAIGLAGVVAWLWLVCGINPLVYAICVAWPAGSLIMIRTYAEHRADEACERRTAIVEAGPFFRLLFLNNNLHALHHDEPRTPWFALPRLYRERREAILDRNGQYRAAGYAEIFRRFLLRRREPIPHPFLRRN